MQISLVEWNQFLGSSYPDAHILQTGEWGELKAGFGWDAVRVSDGTNGAQILYRRLPAGLSIGYLAKGPLGALSPLQAEIDRISAQKRAIFLKWEPDSSEIPGVQSGMNDGDWLSSRPIQPRRTVVISLEGSEEEILSRMKQKTRYNIRLAERKGVVVRPGAPADFPAIAAMYQATAARDGFTVRPVDYYLDGWNALHAAGLAQPLVAEFEGRPIAAVILVRFANRAIYMYGASSNEERERMPNYLLQWESIRWARAQGCAIYDLWGAPDSFDESDRMWGVWRFKAGFNGEVVSYIGAWDFPVRPLLYRLYTQAIPRYLALLRRRTATAGALPG